MRARRLVQTSVGPVEIELGREPERMGGRSVTVWTFDGDGWLADSKTWTERYGHHERGETLPAFLTTVIAIPADEADSLAGEILAVWFEEWRKRGGEAEEEQLNRRVVRTVAGSAIVGLLALLGAVSLFYVAIRALTS